MKMQMTGPPMGQPYCEDNRGLLESVVEVDEISHGNIEA